LMYLFKARQKAQQEYDALRQASGRSQQELEDLARRRGYARSLFYPRHKVAGTASNQLIAIDPRLGRPASPRAASPAAASRVAASPAAASRAAASPPAASPVAVAPTAPSPAAVHRTSRMIGHSRATFRDGVIRLTPVASPQQGVGRQS
jgi:hypothetical protein